MRSERIYGGRKMEVYQTDKQSKIKALWIRDQIRGTQRPGHQSDLRYSYNHKAANWGRPKSFR